MTQANRILEMLEQAGSLGVANHLLADVSLQYNARIFDLRKRGYDIQRKRVLRGGQPSGTWIYYLVPKHIAPVFIHVDPPIDISEYKADPNKLFDVTPSTPVKPWRRMDP